MRIRWQDDLGQRHSSVGPERTFGSSRTFHDHFSLPCNEFPVEEQEQLLALSPRLKEMFQRYMMNYHFHSAFYSDPDHNLVGFHLEEAVYAPLYYGYGGRGEYGDRAALARAFDEEVMQHAPDTVLVLLRARPEVIAQRMREQPHERPVVQEKDIEHVLQRFEEEYRDSLIRKKFALDTSDAHSGADLGGVCRRNQAASERNRPLAPFGSSKLAELSHATALSRLVWRLGRPSWHRRRPSLGAGPAGRRALGRAGGVQIPGLHCAGAPLGSGRSDAASYAL